MARNGGDKRGNNESRRRRKLWLLWWHDRDLPFDRCRCVHCGTELTFTTVTSDRIEAGGSYKRENLQPACLPCNRDRYWIDYYAEHPPAIDDDEPLLEF